MNTGRNKENENAGASAASADYLIDDFKDAFTKNLPLTLKTPSGADTTEKDWDRAIKANALFINKKIPLEKKSQELAREHFATPAIANYITDYANQDGYQYFTQSYYAYRLMLKKGFLSATDTDTKRPQKGSSQYITQPDGSVYFIEQFDTPYYVNPSKRNPAVKNAEDEADYLKYYSDKDAPIAVTVTISHISADAAGNITHSFIGHKVLVLDEKLGKELFDLKNDAFVEKAFKKSENEANAYIKNYIAETISGKNIFQRAWDSITKFASDHRALLIGIAVTTLVIALVIGISIGTLGVGGIAAGVGAGLAYAGIGGGFAGFVISTAAIATTMAAAAFATATYAVFATVTAAYTGLPKLFTAIANLFTAKPDMQEVSKPNISKSSTGFFIGPDALKTAEDLRITRGRTTERKSGSKSRSNSASSSNSKPDLLAADSDSNSTSSSNSKPDLLAADSDMEENADSSDSSPRPAGL